MYVGLFLRVCVCGLQPAYVYLVSAYTALGSRMHTTRQKPYLNNFELLFHLFLIQLQIYHFLSLFMHLKCDSNTILHFIVNLKLYFHCSFTQIVNLTSPYSFLQYISPYSGRGSSNKVVEWYRELAEATKDYIHVVGFEPIICLLPKRSMSTILV